MVFAYTGFRNVIELSGEARDPRRTVPRALIATIVITIVLYLGLQLAFLGAVPPAALAGAGTASTSTPRSPTSRWSSG
jgi:amino acid transporter